MQDFFFWKFFTSTIILYAFLYALLFAQKKFILAKCGCYRLGPIEQALIMYWRIWHLWGPTNLVASTVVMLADTPPYLTDVYWDSVGAPTDARRGITWKACTRVRWARLDSLIIVVNCGHSWCLHEPRVSCCHVLSLAWCIIDLNLRDTLKNGWRLARWVQT
jgi:hypothetical protein